MDSPSEEEEIQLSNEDKLLIMQLVVNTHFGDGDIDSATLCSQDINRSHSYRNSEFSGEIKEMIIKDLAWEFFHLKKPSINRDGEEDKIFGQTPEDDAKLFTMISKVTGDSEDELRERLNNKLRSNTARDTKSTEDCLTSLVSKTIGLQINENTEELDDICSLPTRPNSRANSPVSERIIVNQVELPETEVVDRCISTNSIYGNNQMNEIQYGDLQNSLNSARINSKPFGFYSTDDKESNRNKGHSNLMEMEWKVVGDELFVETSMHSDVEDVTGRKRKNTKHVGIQKSLIPMDDKEGPFFIDKENVSVETYQDGLEKNRWNPTQVLYEICSQSQWDQPEFMLLNYIVGEGFLFAVEVNGHKFCPKERGQTKKLAKHHASTYFLHFLGFKFNFESKKPLVTVLNQPNIRCYHSKVQDRNQYGHLSNISDMDKYRLGHIRGKIPMENYPDPRRQRRPQMTYNNYERKVTMMQDNRTTCKYESLLTKDQNIFTLLKIRQIYETLKLKGERKRKRNTSISPTCETKSRKRYSKR